MSEIKDGKNPASEKLYICPEAKECECVDCFHKEKHINISHRCNNDFQKKRGKQCISPIDSWIENCPPCIPYQPEEKKVCPEGKEK